MMLSKPNEIINCQIFSRKKSHVSAGSHKSPKIGHFKSETFKQESKMKNLYIEKPTSHSNILKSDTNILHN